jgi:hypothetical protein
LEFVKKGDDILLRLEEYDTVRTNRHEARRQVHCPAEDAARSDRRVSWDGDTLVVTTDRIDWTYIDPSGIPQGPSSSIVERITPTRDGTRLSYTMTVTDPATFTAPARVETSVGVAP